MRFLGIGNSCDLGSLYMRLMEDGHAVRVHVGEPRAAGTLAGLVPHVADWRDELPWIRAAGADGIILFESVAEGSGLLQDRLRAEGYNVVGGSAYGDRLENDRAYAQSVLAGLGFSTASVWEFDDPAAADRFIAERPARYVLKFNGPAFYSTDNYVGQFADGRDVRAVLAAKLRDRSGSFILMQHLDGIEMGVGAYFDGERFLLPACIDWEHKRFFAGDLGELTGEMGTVATYERSRRFFDLTLAKVEPLLREGRYVGYVNLNTMVNEAGIWPLEFTCRFGYPGYATLDPIQETSWAELFRAMVTRSGAPFRTRPGFSVALVLSTPPFPYTRYQLAEPVGLPVFFDGALSAEDRANLHYGEVGLQDGGLVTSGLFGWTMVATGIGPTLSAAKHKAYALARRVVVPNLRYRLDIGDRLIGGDWARLDALGLLDPDPRGAAPSPA
jgi:phosphoribosylamine--glycine ligase